MEKKCNTFCENEDWFALIFEHVNDGIIIADPQKRFHYCNRNMCSLLGYSLDEVKTLSVSDLHLPDDLLHVYDRFDQLGKGTITVAREIAVRRKDSSFFYADITGGTFTYKGADYIAGVFRDITKHKETEDELKKTKNMLQLVLDNIPQRVFWKDTHSIYLGCNAGFAEDVNLEHPSHIHGKTDDDFPYLEQHVPNWQAADMRVVSERKRLRSTYAVYKNSAPGKINKMWIKEIKVPLSDAGGNVIGILGSYEDITEDVIREDKVRMLSHRVMQAQEDERSRIARELHDELGQKISAVSLYLDSMRQALPGHMHAVCDKASAIVSETAETIRTLLHRLRPDMLDEVGLIKAMQWYCDTYADGKDGPAVSIRADIADVKKPDVRLALYRIFQEAVTNSIKHAAAGHITVTVSFLKDTVSLTVIDDGCGFDEAAVYKNGTAQCGIGLVSMQERALALSGDVSVQSVFHEGTTVCARLPVERHDIT